VRLTNFGCAIGIRGDIAERAAPELRCAHHAFQRAIERDQLVLPVQHRIDVAPLQHQIGRIV